MKPMKRMPLGLLASFAMQSIVVSTVVAFDDDDDEPKAEVRANQFFAQEADFDRWIFQGNNDAASGRKRIDSHLKLKLDELNRVCQLTEAQQKKLKLAAQGDLKQFFSKVEEVRQKFLKVRNDANAFNNIWQEIHPLQQQQAQGLFGDGSLFTKTIRRTLTDEQQAKYQAALEERRKYRYRAAIETALLTMSNAVALRHDQHEAVLKIVFDETRPPHLFGQYDQYAVMYEMSMMPATKLKPLLDDRQWKLLQKHFDQARSMEPTLIQLGIIDQPKPENLKSVRKFVVDSEFDNSENAN